MPAKVMGGKSRNPSLIASQVEPQIPASASHTSGGRRGWGRIVPGTGRTGSAARGTIFLLVSGTCVADTLAPETDDTISILTQSLSNSRLSL